MRERNHGVSQHVADTSGHAATRGPAEPGSACRLSLVLAGAAALCLGVWVLQGRLPSMDPRLIMALLAAGAGAAAALLAVIAAQPGADHQLAWLSMALVWYGLGAVPLFTPATLDPQPAATTARFLAEALVVGLLVSALVAPPRLSRTGVGTVLLSAAVVVVGATVLGEALPAAADALTSSPMLLALALVWTATGVGVAVQAARRRNVGLGLIGTGVALLGGVRAVHVGTPATTLVDASTGVRLGAVLLVLYGALHLARQALAHWGDTRDTLEEELRVAETRLARAAERDHELRNGLAGLAGATALLGSDRPDRASLGAIVASELDRLDDLLQAPVGPPSAGSTTVYAVATVLQGLAELRRSSGLDVHLDVEPGLEAVGSSATLTQVVTNLIANAERHASGSPIQITASLQDGRIVVQVRDFGAGITPGDEDAAFEPGVRDPQGGGHGLGLHVCRRLLAVEDGTISVRPYDPQAPGCRVVVELPAAPPPTRRERSTLPSHLESAS